MGRDYTEERVRAAFNESPYAICSACESVVDVEDVNKDGYCSKCTKIGRTRPKGEGH